MSGIVTRAGLEASLLLRLVECGGKVDCERPGRPGLQVKIMVRQIVVAGFVLFLSASAQAQRGGGMSGGSRAGGGAPRAATQAPRAGTPQAMPGTRMGPRGGGFRPRTGAAGVRGTGSRTGSQTTTRRRFDGEREGGRFRAGCGSAPGPGFGAGHPSATCGSV